VRRSSKDAADLLTAAYVEARPYLQDVREFKEILEEIYADNEGDLEAILDELRRMAKDHEDPVLRTNARIFLMKVEEITGKETWTP